MLTIKSVEMDERGHMIKVEFGEGCLSGEVDDFLRQYGLQKLSPVPKTLPEMDEVGYRVAKSIRENGVK